MSKRKKQEIDVYIEKVNAKEIEGEYDTRDLCAKHFERELMKKCQAARKFEIHQLLFNGKPTGYGRCSDQSCRDSMWVKDQNAVFPTNPYKTAGAKWQQIERHIKKHLKADNADEAATSAKKTPGPKQTTLNVFSKARKLPQSVIEEMRTHNINVVANRHTSLNFFSKEEVRDRDRTLLKAGGFDPDEVLKFDRTGPTVSKDLERNTQLNTELISKVAPQLAEEGLLALAFDHHEIKNMKNQKLVGINLQDGTTAEAVRPTQALGILLIIKAADGKRYCYLLKYCAVAEKNNQTTLRWARETLKEAQNIVVVFKNEIKLN